LQALASAPTTTFDKLKQPNIGNIAISLAAFMGLLGLWVRNIGEKKEKSAMTTTATVNFSQSPLSPLSSPLNSILPIWTPKKGKVICCFPVALWSFP
jgi:hypothetical protein